MYILPKNLLDCFSDWFFDGELILKKFQERDSLSQKIRSLNATIKELEQSLVDEETKNHEHELRLKKTQNELENMRNKHEQAIKEGQAELLEEK